MLVPGAGAPLAGGDRFTVGTRGSSAGEPGNGLPGAGWVDWQACSSSAAQACTPAKRSFGSFASALSTTCSTYEEIAGAFPRRGQGRNGPMLAEHRGYGAVERYIPAEPLVDDDAQRVLVAGRLGLAPQLFGSQVGERACPLLLEEGSPARRQHSPAHIAEEEGEVLSQQHMLWFDAAVDQLVVVEELHGGERLQFRKESMIGRGRTVPLGWSFRTLPPGAYSMTRKGSSPRTPPSSTRQSEGCARGTSIPTSARKRPTSSPERCSENTLMAACVRRESCSPRCTEAQSLCPSRRTRR